MNAVMEKKPRAKKSKAVGVIERLVTEPVVEQRSLRGTRLPVPVAQLVPHPDNRRPTEQSIDAVAASLESEGLIEPLLVRMLRPADEDRQWPTYQIISGETRFLASRRLGWESIDVQLVELDDAAALRVLAAANAARQDLDPVAKARLIVRLCDPIERGGSGMSREDAARMFDLQSGGAASNLVRLLELPPTWLDRVASGDLAQSYARELLPLLDLGAESAAWGELEKEWAAFRESSNSWDGECFRSREALEDEIFSLIEQHSRPIEKSDNRAPSYYKETGSYEHHSIRFKLTPSLQEELRIVELPLGPNGAMIRRATNCKLYDSFQVPAIKAHIAKKSKGKSATDDDEPAPAAKLTPKQQAAADAERREKAAEVLAKRIELWRAAWLRELVAEAIVDERWADLCVRLCMWLQRQIVVVSYGDRTNLSIDEALADILGHKDAWRGVLARRDAFGPDRLVAHWLRCPVRDGYPHPMPDERVEDLVDLLNIDLADKWLLMQSSGTRPERYQQFFELHSSEQLDTLGTELAVGTTGAAKKSGKVAAFLNAPKTLRLPKSLRSLRKRGAR
jgi:ParB/RepB/Spo0J family partition protein